jgi:hypothetical protein
VKLTKPLHPFAAKPQPTRSVQPKVPERTNVTRGAPRNLWPYPANWCNDIRYIGSPRAEPQQKNRRTPSSRARGTPASVAHASPLGTTRSLAASIRIDARSGTLAPSTRPGLTTGPPDSAHPPHRAASHACTASSSAHPCAPTRPARAEWSGPTPTNASRKSDAANDTSPASSDRSATPPPESPAAARLRRGGAADGRPPRQRPSASRRTQTASANPDPR